MSEDLLILNARSFLLLIPICDMYPEVLRAGLRFGILVLRFDPSVSSSTEAACEDDMRLDWSQSLLLNNIRPFGSSHKQGSQERLS